MTREQELSPIAKSDIDYRLLAPFLAQVVLAQTLILVVRITTSYRVIELGAPVLWLGIIAAAFAIVPAFTALPLGRWIDRGNDARACWIGAALIFVACVGFWTWSSSVAHLMAFSVILGFGHMFCMAGQQMLAVRCGGARSRESVLGYYMVAAATGQGLGPLVVASLAGSVALPPTATLFGIALICAVLGIAVALLIRPADPVRAQPEPQKFVPVSELLKLRGFVAIMTSSVVTVTAQDLLVIYLPALGAERQIDSDHIGFLLTVRSIASLVSRLLYARAIFAIGRTGLTLLSMLASAAGFAVLAIPLPLPVMYVAMGGVGLAIGIASTLTISGVVRLAPAGAYGTALTLRMTGNRIGQIAFPALAGGLASLSGVASILLALGLGLAASGIAVALRQPAAGKT